jgi:4-hydroxy-tetrahydrodipicolinate reductase
MPTQAPPRIALYGTGQYGLEAARIAIAKGWPIVAAYNRAGAKVGQDLGRLAGLDRDLGVIVEDCETADYAAAGADIALVALTDRLQQNLPAYERLLGAGMNIVCHGAEAYFPQATNADLAAKIDALAVAAGVSFTGTGVWDFSRIWAGILIAGPSTELRSMLHVTVTDAESASAFLMRNVCGVSMTPEEYVTGAKMAIGGLYGQIPHHVLHALGYTVTKVEERREPVIGDKPVYCRLLDRTLEPGLVLGTRIIAEVETAEGVTASAHIELRILNEGENEHMAWAIDGKPSSKIRIDRTDSVHTSASCLVNRIPDVIAAAPGIRLVSELGVLKPKSPATPAREARA